MQISCTIFTSLCQRFARPTIWYKRSRKTAYNGKKKGNGRGTQPLKVSKISYQNSLNYTVSNPNNMHDINKLNAIFVLHSFDFLTSQNDIKISCLSYTLHQLTYLLLITQIMIVDKPLTRYLQ